MEGSEPRIHWCNEVGTEKIRGPYHCEYNSANNQLSLIGYNKRAYGMKWYLVAWYGAEDTPENRAVLMDLWVLRHGAD